MSECAEKNFNKAKMFDKDELDKKRETFYKMFIEFYE